MTGFAKLWSEILSSSIWNEDDKTRIVWITMLASMGRDYIVRASLAGLAHQARVSKEDCEKAMNVLCSPDPDSRSPDFEGRRVEKVEGGFRILNGGKYREARSEGERKSYMKSYMHEYRRRKKEMAPVNSGVNLLTLTVNNVNSESLQIPTPKAKKPPTEKGISFAEWFNGLLPDGQKHEDNWRQNWARCYDQMISIDGRTAGEIAKICQWAREDEFWGPNFLSPAKLRHRDKNKVLYYDLFKNRMEQKSHAFLSVAARQASEDRRRTGQPAIHVPIFDPMDPANQAIYENEK